VVGLPRQPKQIVMMNLCNFTHLISSSVVSWSGVGI
jgi:hypothetical protein